MLIMLGFKLILIFYLEPEYFSSKARPSSSKPSQHSSRHFFIHQAVATFDLFLLVLPFLSLRARNVVFPNLLVYFLRNFLYFMKENI